MLLTCKIQINCIGQSFKLRPFNNYWKHCSRQYLNDHITTRIGISEEICPYYLYTLVYFYYYTVARTCQGWADRGLREDADVEIMLEDEVMWVKCQFTVEDQLSPAMVVG